MADILKAIGPAGVMIFLFGSGLLYISAQVHQMRQEIQHEKFMRIKGTARLVEHDILPIAELLEDMRDLEESLKGPDASLMTHMLKLALD
jgi:hypothetical protein